MPTATIQTTTALHVDYTDTYPITFNQVKNPATPTILSPSDSLYIKPAEIPAGLRKKNITSLDIKLYAKYLADTSTGTVQTASVAVNALAEPYDASKIQTQHMIPMAYTSAVNVYSNTGYTWLTFEALYHKNKIAVDYIRNGLYVMPSNGFIYPTRYLPNWCEYLGVYPPGGTTAPYISITYEDAVLSAGSLSPASGWVDRTKPVTFTWLPTTNAITIDPVTQSSAVFSWRVGSSGTINTINLTTETAVTLAANTLPENSDVMWRVQITSDDNVTDTSDWYTITTNDAIPTVTGVSPTSSYVDGTSPATFVWDYNIATGSPQNKYELQYKTASTDWIPLKAETTPNTYSVIEKDTLPSGTIYWRVRAANTSEVFSAWSETETAIVIAAPATPAIHVETISPRPEISWQSIEQQAYQVQMGTYDSGIVFGTAKTYKCPIYLHDGNTILRVRVLNEYSMWSEWAELTVDIKNTPGNTYLLRVNPGVDNELIWSAAEGATKYLIFRDIKLIGETEYTQYIDRYSISASSYFVRAVFADSDNYTDSNTVQVVTVTEYPLICDMDGGDWIKLEYSTVLLPTLQVTSAQEISLMQYSGADYPIPEKSNFKTQTFTVNTAFRDLETARRFEALIGKRVCMKDQYGNIVIGIITSTARVQSHFYTAYTAVINKTGE